MLAKLPGSRDCREGESLLMTHRAHQSSIVALVAAMAVLVVVVAHHHYHEVVLTLQWSAAARMKTYHSEGSRHAGEEEKLLVRCRRQPEW